MQFLEFTDEFTEQGMVRINCKDFDRIRLCGPCWSSGIRYVAIEWAKELVIIETDKL